MSIQVAKPESIKIPILKDDWIEVRKYLNTGETIKMYTAMMKADGQSFDSMRYGFNQVKFYLLNWTLQHLDGSLIAIEGKEPDDIAKALELIKPEAFSAIYKAVSEHIDAMKAETEAEKNDQATGNESPSISPSVA